MEDKVEEEKVKEVKLVLISDTHGRHGSITSDLPEGHVIIHTGDTSMRGRLHELKEFLIWYSSLLYPHKILIAGNHDWAFDLYPLTMEEMLKEFPGITYLEQSSVTIEGLKIWGSPYTPHFHDWAFNVHRDKIGAKWEEIPMDTDIILTHGPAYGYGDEVIYRGQESTHAGCESLFARIEEIKPRLHVFGHIHSGEKWTANTDTIFINASVLDNAYQYTHTIQHITLTVKDDGLRDKERGIPGEVQPTTSGSRGSDQADDDNIRTGQLSGDNRELQRIPDPTPLL